MRELINVNNLREEGSCRAPMRKRKGVGLWEGIAYLVIIAIIIAVVTPYLQDAFKSAEVITTKQTLKELKNAAINYRSNSINGQYPDDLTKLLTGLSASESRTGVAIKFVDKAEWFEDGVGDASKVVDQWGSQISYTKSATSGESSVSSTGNGEEIIEMKF